MQTPGEQKILLSLHTSQVSQDQNCNENKPTVKTSASFLVCCSSCKLVEQSKQFQWLITYRTQRLAQQPFKASNWYLLCLKIGTHTFLHSPDRLEADGWLLMSRRFQEFHGRLGFTAQILPGLKPDWPGRSFSYRCKVWGWKGDFRLAHEGSEEHGCNR